MSSQIKEYEKLDSEEERLSRSRQIYDGYIMKELLSCSHVRPQTHCQKKKEKHIYIYFFLNISEQAKWISFPVN